VTGTLLPIETHEPAGVLQLRPPFWGLPRVAALLVSWLEQAQAFEDALWTFLDGIDVDTCERYALERLSVIVGEPARPTDTETLRVLVRGRIAANRSTGRPSDLTNLVSALCGSTDCTLLLFGNAIKVITPPLAAPDAAVQLLDDAAASGVAVAWTVVDTTSGTPFSLPDADNPTPNNAACMGSGIMPTVYR